MGKLQDIDIIHCYINLRGENSLLFNNEEIRQKISEEVITYFNKYSLHYELGLPGGMGGGGGALVLWEILKIAWQHKDLIGATIAIIKAGTLLPKRVFLFITNLYPIGKPTVSIAFNLRTEEDYNFKNASLLFSHRLFNLKYLSDEICSQLKIKYPIFNFNQAFSIYIGKRHFSTDYFVEAEQQNNFNTQRLLNLFKALHIRDNLHITYRFTKWFFITRKDLLLTPNDNSSKRKKLETYFLLFSSRVLKDFFRNGSKV